MNTDLWAALQRLSIAVLLLAILFVLGATLIEMGLVVRLLGRACQ